MISDITYEQITGDYWYANYLGFKVIMMKSSGFVNATKLCLSGGKRFDNWTRLQGSKELANFLDMKILEEEKIANQERTIISEEVLLTNQERSTTAVHQKLENVLSP